MIDIANNVFLCLNRLSIVFGNRNRKVQAKMVFHNLFDNINKTKEKKICEKKLFLTKI